MSLTLAAISIAEWDSSDPQEADLVQICHSLATAQQDSSERFATPELCSWEASFAEVDRLHRTLAEIAHQPARTSCGVRAKAAALKSLLQSGGADVLHDDASAPDQLAWSLVRDLLALMPPVLSIPPRLPPPDERRSIRTSA
jgi:hypothetical protein